MGNLRTWWWIGGALVIGLSAWLVVSNRSEPAVAPTFTSLAVLPFAGPAADAAQVHLARGLSVDLLYRLQTLETLQVSPRDQVFDWNAEDRSHRALARRLGAEILVLGEVDLLAGSVTLRLEILDARNDLQIASIELKESRERLFDLQSRAAREVLAALRIPLRGTAKTWVRRQPTRSLKAWDFGVQGRGYLEDPTNPRGADFAVDRYRRAIQLDPDFAFAHVGLSEALWLRHLRSPDPDGLAEAELEARWVLSRHPDLSPAAISLTKVLLTSSRFAAIPFHIPLEIERLNKPDEALRDVSTGLLQVGRLELAEAALRTATERHGDLWLNSYSLGQFLLRGGRYAEAAVAFQESANRAPPDMTWPTENLTKLSLAAGDFDHAISLFETLEPVNWIDVETIHQVAAAYAILGRLVEAEQLYRRALEIEPLNSMIYQGLGDVLARRGYPHQAAENFAEGLRIVEKNLEEAAPEETMDLQLRLALLAAKSGDCSRSLPIAASLRRHPRPSAEGFHDLAVVFAICQDLESALEALQVALNLGLAPERVTSEAEFQPLMSATEVQTILSAPGPIPPRP